MICVFFIFSKTLSDNEVNENVIKKIKKIKHKKLYL